MQDQPDGYEVARLVGCCLIVVFLSFALFLILLMMIAPLPHH